MSEFDGMLYLPKAFEKNRLKNEKVSLIVIQSVIR